MSRKQRLPFEPGYYYHILNRGNNKKQIFKDDEDKDYFYDLFWDVVTKQNISIDTFCVMNTHFHIEVNITENVNISNFMQKVCTSYAMYYNKKYEKIGHVFQDRYKAKKIFTFQGVLNVRKYIRNNPVKEGLVDKPEDYRWLWTK